MFRARTCTSTTLVLNEGAGKWSRMLGGDDAPRGEKEIQARVIFGLTFALLIGAALGLAVGAFRGRPLPPGSCRESYLAGGLLPRCEACPVLNPSSASSAASNSASNSASGAETSGGFDHAYRS